jgi:hypothetical protein
MELNPGSFVRLTRWLRSCCRLHGDYSHNDRHIGAELVTTNQPTGKRHHHESLQLLHLEEVVLPGSKIEVKPPGLEFIAAPVVGGGAEQIAQFQLFAGKAGEG